MTRRDPGIDTLRGIACILLVALHVIGETIDQGLQVPDDHPLAQFAAVFFHVRMPLFSVLSGFVYAWHPVAKGKYTSFVGRKIRRLGLPFLVITTCFAAAHTLLGGSYAVTINEAWEIYLTPYAHMWFLQAIFMLFLIIAAADLAFPDRPFLVACALVVCFALVFLSPIGRGVEWLSIDRALYLAPFFFAGTALARYPLRPPSPATIAMLTGAGLILAFQVFETSQFIDRAPDRRTLLGLATGLLVCGTLVIWRRPIAGLARLGQSSYAIYLFHLFPVMGLQAVYSFIGLPYPPIGLALGLLLGLGLPIVAEQLIQQLSRIRQLQHLQTIFLGLRARR